MKKPAVAFALLLLLAAVPLRAAEMFETYPKHFALGYIVDPNGADAANGRYWFNPNWALDLSAGIVHHNELSSVDDGVVLARDHSNSEGYSLAIAAVRALKNYEYFSLNLKAGATYAHSKTYTDPEGPNNNTSERIRNFSLIVGPEVEIKVPYVSRLVIVTSVLAAYRVRKTDSEAADIAGTTFTKNKTYDFSLQNDGNSLDRLFHLGIRYYF